MDILFFRFAWGPSGREEEIRARMIELIKKAQPKFVVPTHYGTFTSLRADPEEIQNEVETEKTKMLIFYPGQIRKIQFNS